MSPRRALGKEINFFKKKNFAECLLEGHSAKKLIFLKKILCRSQSWEILASASSRVPVRSRCLATSGINDGFCGETLPSALNEIWLIPVTICCHQKLIHIVRKQFFCDMESIDARQLEIQNLWSYIKVT